MSAVQDFIDFVLNHPGYYHVAKSRVFMLILEFICSGTKSMLDVYKKFEKIEKPDIDQMIETLVSLGLTQKQATAAGLFIDCTTEGRSLLEKVTRSKQELLLSPA